MTRASRLLGGVNSATVVAQPPPIDPSAAGTVDSDFVVILAALLCALICVLGLIAVARCAWLRRLSSSSSAATTHPPPPPSSANKGLKKKVLKSLPKVTYDEYHSSSGSAIAAVAAAKFSECAICLAEFVGGDEIRVLPQCGHTFHVACIDTWLGSHSSCPSCRQILVVARCQKCGGFPGSSSSTGAADTSNSDTEARLKQTEDHINRFLP